MTVPINPDGTIPADPEGTSEYTPPGSESFDDTGVVYGAAFSALNSRTQENITASLQAQLSANPIWDGLWDAFWAIVRIPGDFLLDVLEKLFPGIDWDALREFNLFETIEDLVTGAVDALKEVPFLGDLIYWVTGIADGARELIDTWFANLRAFLGHINLFSPDFNLVEAAESFVEFILFPVWRILPWDFVRDFLEKLFPALDWSWLDPETFDISAIGQGIIDAVSRIPFVGDILTWLTGAATGTWETLNQWFANLREFLGHINFFGPDFDLLAAAETFIDFVLAPVKKLISLDWLFDFLETIFPSLDWDALRALDAGQFLESILLALKEVPFVGTIVTGILGIGDLAWDSLVTWFDNLRQFFGQINFLSPDFDLLGAAESFIEFILYPVWRIVPWEWLVDVLQKLFPGLDWTWLETLDISEWAENIYNILERVPFVGDILFWITGAAAGTWETLQEWFSNLREFFGFINFFGPDFDLLAAAETFIDFVLFPVGKIAEIGRGLLDWLRGTLVDPVISALLGDGFSIDLASLGVWARNLLSGRGPIPAENLQGQVSSSLFGVIPVAHISNTQLNLLTQGNFDSPDMIDAADGWEWDDSVTKTGTGGSLKLTLTPGVQIMYCNQSIPVGPGDKVALQGWVKTTGFVGSGEPLRLDLIPFAGQTQLDAEPVGETGAAEADFVQIYGPVYQVPAGVDSVRVRLTATAAASSGVVHWDDIRVVKTGFLQQGLVERLTDAWNNFWNGIFGSERTDADVDDILYAASAVENTASGAARDLATLAGDLIARAGEVIGNIGGVLMDGLNTVGDFLRKLWEGFTGLFAGGAARTVQDVSDAASGVQVVSSGAATTADRAEGKADDAQDAADEAQTTADGAVLLADAVVASGDNVIANSSFEEDFWISPSTGGVYSTTRARNGSRSLRMLGNNGTPYNVVSTNLDGEVYVPASTGEQFYFETWVYGESTNTQSHVGAIRLTIMCYNELGGVTGSNTLYFDTSTALNSKWTKLSGTLEVTPLNTSRILPRIQFNGVAVGHVFYFDDVVFREVTAAVEAQDAADEAAGIAGGANLAAGEASLAAGEAELAAQEATTLAESIVESGSNVIVNGSFEKDFYLPNIAAAQYSTTVARTGSRSLKLTGTGGLVAIPVCTGPSNEVYVPAAEGDRFYMECWVYGATNVVRTDGILLTLEFYNSAGSKITESNAGFDSSPSLNGQWTRLVANFEVTGSTTVKVRPLVRLYGVASGQVMYFDDVTFREVTAASKAEDAATAADGKAGGALDGIVRGFLGFDGSGFTASESEEAARETASSITGLSSQIAQLKQEDAAGSYSGTAIYEDFSSYAVNATSLGPEWSQWAFNAGSALYGISSTGRASMTGTLFLGTNPPRRAYVRYSSLATQTDVQRIGVVFATSPAKTANVNTYILGRMNTSTTASGMRYVFAKFNRDENRAYIGYFNGSSEVYMSGGNVSHSFKTGTTYWFDCGESETASGLRVFRLWEGTNLVMTATDTTNSSLVGSGYRYTGFSGTAIPLNFPAQIGAFAAYDNVPPTYRGVAFKRYKSTGTGSFPVNTAGVPAADFEFPNNHFDQQSYITDGLTYDAANEELVIGVEGWYAVTVVQHGNSAMAIGSGYRQAPLVFKNAAVAAYGPVTQGNSGTGYCGFGGTMTVYCEVGDRLKPGMWSKFDGTNAQTTLLSAGNGNAQTYWSVEFIHNKKTV